MHKNNDENVMSEVKKRKRGLDLLETWLKELENSNLKKIKERNFGDKQTEH